LLGSFPALAIVVATMLNLIIMDEWGVMKQSLSSS
jgi:hypothetical protein